MPDLNPELRRILKAVRHTQGFRLMFAEFNHFGRREQLIKQINQQLESPSTIHQLNQVPYHLPDWLDQDVAPLAQQHRLIHILTPEFNRDNQAALEQFFLHLNYMRESLAQTCACALLFWLSGAALRACALSAPDLWNWRSLIVDVSQPLKQNAERTFNLHERTALDIPTTANPVPVSYTHLTLPTKA